MENRYLVKMASWDKEAMSVADNIARFAKLGKGVTSPLDYAKKRATELGKTSLLAHAAGKVDAANKLARNSDRFTRLAQGMQNPGFKPI